MAQLAILGHPTRGKEVIEILEMLGGKNTLPYLGGSHATQIYYIRTSNNEIVSATYSTYSDSFKVYTLEEFLEKFPYKVGDKVDTTYNNRLYEGEVKSMRWYCEDECVLYQVDFIHNLRVENILVRYNNFTKGIMEEINIDSIGFNGDKAKLILPDGYEFKTEGKEVYVVKKKPQYSKTYEECCEILDVLGNINIEGYKKELLLFFQQLLVCRDAYWKIVGNEMGLGKPWKPNWLDGEYKWGIAYSGTCIDLIQYKAKQRLLVFPTEEMRDAFYENFKELIEECKELL